MIFAVSYCTSSSLQVNVLVHKSVFMLFFYDVSGKMERFRYKTLWKTLKSAAACEITPSSTHQYNTHSFTHQYNTHSNSKLGFLDTNYSQM